MDGSAILVAALAGLNRFSKAGGILGRGFKFYKGRRYNPSGLIDPPKTLAGNPL
jgi:hypothetical protein